MNAFMIKYRDNPGAIRIKHFLTIILGNALLAAGYGLFMIPHNIVAGGLGGIAVLVKEYIDPIFFITIFTWGFFVVGLIFLGKKFALKTLVSSIVYPIFLQIFTSWTWFFEQTPNVTLAGNALSVNTFLYAIIGAVLSGVGIGLVFRSGGSTGGVDIPGFIAQKYIKVPSEKIVFLSDIIIIAFAIQADLVNGLLGILVAILILLVINRYTVGGKDIVIAHIISSKYQEINDYIINELSRGSTIIPAIGGYQSSEKMMIEAAIGSREFSYLSDYIKSIDPDAFVILLSAREVYGIGFRRH